MRLSQNSGGGSDRATIEDAMDPCPLTPTLSLWGRELSWNGFTIPSPKGRGTQGEGICVTIPLVPRFLRQFRMPVPPNFLLVRPFLLWTTLGAGPRVLTESRVRGHKAVTFPGHNRLILGFGH
jgi:hypothetical protein